MSRGTRRIRDLFRKFRNPPVTDQPPEAPVEAVREALRDRSTWTLGDAERELILSHPQLARRAERHPQVPLSLLVLLDEQRPYGEARENLLRRLSSDKLFPKAWEVFSQSDWEIRAALAVNPHLPAGIRRRLLNDQDWWVLASLAENPSLDAEDALHLMRRDPPVAVRENLAAHPASPAALLVALAADGDKVVRRNVAKNVAAPAAALELLAADPLTGTREAVAAHPATPPAVTAALMSDPQERVRQVAALRAGAVPPDELRAAAAQRRRAVRLAVSQHPRLPADLQQQLAADRWAQVRAELAVRPDLPDELRDCLREDGDQTVAQLTRAADPRTPGDELAFLPRRDPRMRRALSSNANAPLQVLEELSTDREYLIRERVMLNPSAPPSALAEGLGERSLRRHIRQHPHFAHVREQLYAQEIREAQAPETGLDALLELAGSDGQDVRLTLAHRPALQEELIMRLAQDESVAVLRTVLQRPELTAEALHLMARPEGDTNFLVVLLQHPLVDEVVLGQLATVRFQSVRQLVARHPLTPLATLRVLAQQKDMHAEVASHPHADAALLRGLVPSRAYEAQQRLERLLRRTPAWQWGWVEHWVGNRRLQIRRAAVKNLNVLEKVAAHPQTDVQTLAYLRWLHHPGVNRSLEARARREP